MRGETRCGIEIHLQFGHRLVGLLKLLDLNGPQRPLYLAFSEQAKRLKFNRRSHRPSQRAGRRYDRRRLKLHRRLHARFVSGVDLDPLQPPDSQLRALSHN